MKTAREVMTAWTSAARLQPTGPGRVDMAPTVPIMDTTAIGKATSWGGTMSSQQAVRAGTAGPLCRPRGARRRRAPLELAHPVTGRIG